MKTEIKWAHLKELGFIAKNLYKSNFSNLKVILHKLSFR